MEHRSPIEAARSVAGPYRGAALQRSCILARLMRGPASRPDLERYCRVPSVTKRISELRAEGFEIERGWAIVTGADGASCAVTVYALASRDDRQGDLFGEGAEA